MSRFGARRVSESLQEPGLALKRLISCFCITMAICLSPLPAIAQNASFEKELKLIDGLRSRQLYSLADAHCDTLRSGKTDAITSAAVTIEQIKIQVARGISASGDGRNEFANRIDTIAEQFETQHPAHSRRIKTNPSRKNSYESLLLPSRKSNRRSTNSSPNTGREPCRRMNLRPTN